MIIKQTDKNDNLIEFRPKEKFKRYTVNGEIKKGMTTTIGDRFKGGLLTWKQNVVFEAMGQVFRKEKLPIDLISKYEKLIQARVKEIEDSASIIGSNFHEIAEAYAKGENPPEPQTEPLVTMFTKFKTFWDASGYKIVHTEMPVYSKDLDIAGTFDLIITKDKWKDKEGNQQYALVDMKTSKDFYVDQVLQIHGYKKLIEDSLDIKISKLGVLNIPKEPNKNIEMRWYKQRSMFLNAVKACHYLTKAQLKYNELEKERKKQKTKRSKKNV